MQRSPRTAALAGLMGSLLIAAVVAAPAMARTNSRLLTLRPRAVSFNEANATSTGFAGWAFYKTTRPASVSVKYKEPSLNCGTATKGVSAAASVFTGSSSSPVQNSAGTLVVCSGGKPFYVPALVVANSETNLTHAVAAGDLVKVSVLATATKRTVTFSDLTSPRKFTKTISGTGAKTVLDEQIGDGYVSESTGPLPIVNFHSIAYRAGVVDGSALGAVTPSEAFNMVSSTNVLQIVTSALQGTAENAFTTTWKHS